WKKQEVALDEKITCVSNNCNGILEQVTWCAVSNKGYLAEVPWHFICHLDSLGECRPDYDSEYLKVTTNQNGRRVILCHKCGSKHPFEKLKTLNQINQHQPWIFEGSPELEEADKIEILEVNNPGVYIPERVNALVIPPESRISQATLVDKLFRNSKLCREIDSIRIPFRRKVKIKEVARQLKASASEIEQALKEIKKGYPWLDDFSVNDLYEDEYKAFLEPLEDQKEDEDFVTEHLTNRWNNLTLSELPEDLGSIISIVDRVVSARRLREIQVFKGFYRLSSEAKENLVPPDITGESNWLPAIELFGEGIFFTLDKAILEEWENKTDVIKRADKIKQLYEKAQINFFQDIEVTPRFILLHTLSHLLIRELEASAGYPAASLKERIYCSKSKEMAGILVYTAVPDIVGSLGGIINSAEPTTLLTILDNVFKKARWCSLDPVCTEHEGQGPGWLNRAACHACSLIPEPACEYGNVFLDRVFIKGDAEKGIPPFLDFTLQHKENFKKE
ncbi:MAG: DUF1998 domain-containing protein, partial [Methylococcaceae bacterium]|nr:DUF1998 domain-containing protein [Methylococcaceae bacterium]